MRVRAIKTKKIYPKEEFFSFLFSSLPLLLEQQVLVISSKILSLCYGYFVRKEETKLSKNALIQRESNYYWDCEEDRFHQLTIKKKCFIPFAGVDESNGAGTYILFPRNLFFHAADIWQKLRVHYKLQKLGILIVDSQIVPLRKGTLGLGLSWCGFYPCYSYVGGKDCFNHKYQMTDLNLVDAYATSAILVMGEGNEQCPLAIIDDAPKIRFMNSPTSEKDLSLISINVEEDLFYPLLCGVKPMKGGSVQ